MTDTTRLIVDKRPISPMRQKCKPCPFCGSIPYIDQGKLRHCQLHGEPMQSIIVYCKKHECAAKPSVSAGDIHNGGLVKAQEEAITLWNKRQPSEGSEV